jgi:tight adherence protein C
MGTPILTILVTIPGLLTLVCAMMLVAGGVALIASEIRKRREMLTQRVDLVRTTSGLTQTEKEEVVPVKKDAFRSTDTGPTEVSQRVIAQAYSKLGLPVARASTYFVLTQLLVSATLGALLLMWARNVEAFAAAPVFPFMVMFMFAIIGWFLPKLALGYMVKQRTKVVRSGLPDALELLVVCAEAGMSLEDGLGRVVEELQASQPALADELGLTLADLRILPSREQALLNFAERVNVPTVRTVVGTLAQTLRYGTPLAQALRVVAAEMRNEFLFEMEERANRLPAYMTVPVMLFLMPTIFLIVGGPAALKLLDSFQNVQLVPG